MVETAEKRICDRITEETKDIMFLSIDKTEKSGRERGFSLCEDKDKNIVPSNVCVGTEECVSLERAKCPINTRDIGDFHTHLYGYMKGFRRPSTVDIVQTASHGRKSLCIGETHNRIDHIGSVNNVDCYDIKDKKMLELGNKSRELVQKRKFKEATEIRKEILKRVIELGGVVDIFYPRSTRDILDNKCSLTKKRDIKKKKK